MNGNIEVTEPIKVEPGPMITRQVPFEYTLAPLEGIKLVAPSPVTGKIIEVLMSWPDGCEDPVTGTHLVGIAFGHGDHWMLPSDPDTYLKLNNTSPTFRNLSEPVSRNEELWVVLRNADDTNIHAVSIAATVQGVP